MRDYRLNQTNICKAEQTRTVSAIQIKFTQTDSFIHNSPVQMEMLWLFLSSNSISITVFCCCNDEYFVIVAQAKIYYQISISNSHPNFHRRLHLIPITTSLFTLLSCFFTLVTQNQTVFLSLSPSCFLNSVLFYYTYIICKMRWIATANVMNSFYDP